MSFDILLNKIAEIKRLTNSTDRYGNIEKIYATQISNIPIRLDEQTGSEEEINANTTIKRAKAYTRYDDILPSDVLLIDGDIYEVIAYPLLRQRASLTHHYEIELKRVYA